MKQDNKASRSILIVYISIMALMIVLGLVFQPQLETFLNRPSLYPHVLFAHITVVTLFFANAIIGILWEYRSLASNSKEVILHTYKTVAWLDARFSSPLIIASVVTGVILTTMYGKMGEVGWLLLAFIPFLLSGAVWIISDIPTQYKIKRGMEHLGTSSEAIPEDLLRLLRLRLWISLGGVLPLIAVFVLMVYKPEITL